MIHKATINTTERPAARLSVLTAPDDLDHVTGVAMQTVTAEDPEAGTVTVSEVADIAPIPRRYAPLVEALIGLRYTTGAEIALSRRPAEDPERIEYLAFVEEVKAAAAAALPEGRE